MPSSTLLPTPRAGEQAHALAAPDRQHAVDRAHADIERLSRSARASSGLSGAAFSGAELRRMQRAKAVQRAAGAVEHAPQQLVADRQVARRGRSGGAADG